MNGEKKCPRCGEMYDDYPAVSRRDNKTEICSACGQEEALIDAGFMQRTENEKAFFCKLGSEVNVRLPMDINGCEVSVGFSLGGEPIDVAYDDERGEHFLPHGLEEIIIDMYCDEMAERYARYEIESAESRLDK